MQRRRPPQSDEKEEKEKFVKQKDKKTGKHTSKLFSRLFISVLAFLYLVIPLSFYLCPAIRQHAVFLHYVSLSQYKNLSNPTEAGLNCTRNFYINSGNDVKLGVWHVPPNKMLSQCKDNNIPLTKEFDDTLPVFLYLHGNAGTRAGSHRVHLYKVLSEKLNVHVIAFDYRGYGDSTNVPPTQHDIVQDARHIYEWLIKKVDPSRIFVWGHSLGTAVGVSLLAEFDSTSRLPAALILEAPFTTIVDAAYHHPLSIFHRYMPFFNFFIADPIGEGATGFNTISKIGNVKCPILILHAEDDGFVPFEQGKRLYEQALASRPNLAAHVTQFIAFDAKLDFGHKNIYKNPELPQIIGEFIKNIKAKPSAKKS